MWRVTLNGLWSHKLRLALTAIAIVLGVTFITGTYVLTDTLHQTFTTLFSGIYKNLSFQVRGVAQFTGQFGVAVERRSRRAGRRRSGSRGTRTSRSRSCASCRVRRRRRRTRW